MDRYCARGTGMDPNMGVPQNGDENGIDRSLENAERWMEKY